MKTFLKIALALLAISQIASAETHSNAKNGFYVGLNTGVALNEGTLKAVYQNGKFNKDANSVMLGLFGGYGYKFNNFVVGVDLNGGVCFSAKAKFYEKELYSAADTAAYALEINSPITGDTVTGWAKRTFDASVMPKFGWLANRNCELFVMAGANISTYSVKSDINFSSVNKTKIAPAVGAGVKYGFTDSLFATLAYHYVFKGNICDIIDSTKKKTCAIDYSSHILKLGIGYQF